MSRQNQWWNLMLLLPLVFHLVRATESIEDWRAEYMWIVHEKDVTDWWDPLYVYRLVSPLQPLSPSDKRDQLTELVKAVLANGDYNDKRLLSNVLVVDNQKIAQFLPDETFEALLKLPGIVFRGPIMRWEEASNEEALVAVEAFMSKPFHPSLMKRLGAVGLMPFAMDLNQGDLGLAGYMEDLTEGRPQVTELLSLYKGPLQVALAQCQDRLHDPVCIGELRYTGANYFAAVWNVVLEPRVFPPDVYSEVNMAIRTILALRAGLEAMNPHMDVVSFQDDGRYAIPFMWDDHHSQLQSVLVAQEAALVTVKIRTAPRRIIPSRFSRARQK